MKSVNKMNELTFSKKMVVAVMATYFLGVAIGGLVVWFKCPEQLYSYLTFIGAPTATAFGFYMWKAKNENIHKNPNIEVDTQQQCEGEYFDD